MAVLGTATGDSATPHVENVLPFALACLEAGQRVCLVTLIGVDGSTPRALGAQMAVSQDGRAIGSFTGGCLEGVVTSEALRVMETNKRAIIRFGKGSRFFDIVLPCGSGLDLHFEPAPNERRLKQVLECQKERKPAAIALEMSLGAEGGVRPRESQSDSEREFVRWYLPRTRLLVAGDSPAAPILASLAEQADLDVVRVPQSHTTTDCQTFDRWTGVAMLFHDHAKEDSLLTQALRSDCFYIGALGSHGTHKARLSRLSDVGFTSNELNRIRSPIGLMPGAKSPVELAVSALAEIIDEARSLRHVIPT